MASRFAIAKSVFQRVQRVNLCVKKALTARYNEMLPLQLFTIPETICRLAMRLTRSTNALSTRQRMNTYEPK